MAFIGNTVTTQGFTPAIDYFNGDGTTTAFTLSRPVASVAQVQVVVNNVPQLPGTAFTVSGNTITFTGTPSAGTNNIYVYYTSPITQVIAPSQGTVQTAQLGNITNIASGNSSLTLQTGSGNTTAVTIDTSQNVGIGTGSPSTYANSNAPVLAVGTSTNIATIQGRTDGPASYTNCVSIGGSYQTNPINGSRIVLGAAGPSGQQGGVFFYTKNSDDNTTQPTLRMSIDSNGRITTPSQPMFTARSSVSGNIAVGTAQLVPLNDYFVNVGSCYNNSTYRFTAPVAGQYQFTISGMLNTGQTTTGNGSIRLRKNGAEFTYTHMNGVHPASACATIIVSAAVNDYFEFYADNCYYQGASNYITLFSGQLVG